MTAEELRNVLAGFFQSQWLNLLAVRRLEDLSALSIAAARLSFGGVLLVAIKTIARLVVWRIGD